VGAVFEEFEHEMQRLHQQYGDNPRQELLQLFLLALEREELVAVSYRESLMQQRLARMPLEEDAKEVIRHALIWIWKDEEMHAIYIRGAILRFGGFFRRSHALLTQLAGGLGGWAGSVMQHTPWRAAPLAKSAAWLITQVGKLAGKVPPEVRQYLQYGPFRNFCLFNVEAEKTAATCWYRIADLSDEQPEMGSQIRRDFRRIAEDEDRHAEVFAILADALNDDDDLVAERSCDHLVKRLRDVGTEFLPRRHRGVNDLQNPIGSGQPVYVLRGTSRQEKSRLFQRLLEESNLIGALRNRSQFLDRPVSAMTVAIKPTFMLGYSRQDMSPITDPALIEQLANFLTDAGCGTVQVIEGPNIYDQFFHNRSVHDVARYFDLNSDVYQVIDTADDQVAHDYPRGMAQYSVSRAWRDADFRISFPKVRSHPIETALLSVGNIEWIGNRCDEYLFLERQADRGTAIMMLLDEFPPHFAILDCFEDVPDGLIGAMGCRHPHHPLRFYASADPLAVDTVALKHLGASQATSASILRMAQHWFGNSEAEIEVRGDDSTLSKWKGPYANDMRIILSAMAYPVYVMGSGRGALFVPEMDLEAFPLMRKENARLKFARRMIRRLLGLKLPAEQPTNGGN
jgi:uncharacterized protein (DUF362 family)